MFELSEINKKQEKHWQLLPYMIGYHLSLMTAIRNTGTDKKRSEGGKAEEQKMKKKVYRDTATDFWRRGGGTAKECEL